MSNNIDAKTAVKIAIEFAEHVYKGEKDDSPLEAIRVEEVDFSQDDTSWLITLGWNDQAFQEIPSAEMSGARSKIPRTYKVFHVDATDGTLKKIKRKEP